MSYNKRRVMDAHDAEYNIQVIFDESGITVSKDLTGKLHVDCNRSDIGYAIHTSDVLEAAAALMHSKTLRNNRKLWDVKLSSDDIYGCDPANALYWLSGGDAEWVDGFRYNKKWSSVADVYLDRFGSDLFDAVEVCSTFADLRYIYSTEFKLQYFYEFALENNFITLP
jgi:hypothetical protein